MDEKTIQTSLANIPDKTEDKNTTTLRFKRDLIEFFNYPEFQGLTALEMGVHQGMTTRVLSFLFNTVYACQPGGLTEQKWIRDRDNIVSVDIDSYRQRWADVIDEEVDVFVIDAVHTYAAVKSDIDNALSMKSKGAKWLVLDDYGLFPEVAKAIDGAVKEGRLEIIALIGTRWGETIRGKVLGPGQGEGVICRERR